MVTKMIRLSMNVLASSLALLNRIETYSFSSLSELAYSKIVSISAEDIFSFSASCGWVSENENALILTKHGTGLLRLQAQGLLIDLKRQMLADYVLKTAPIWSNRIPYGRREATICQRRTEKIPKRRPGNDPNARIATPVFHAGTLDAGYISAGMSVGGTVCTPALSRSRRR